LKYLAVIITTGDVITTTEGLQSPAESHLRHNYVYKSSLHVIIKHDSRNSGFSARCSADKFL